MGLFIRAGNKMRENGYKPEEGRFRLNTMKKLFTVRLVKHWNRLPSEAVDAPRGSTGIPRRCSCLWQGDGTT